jgi:hypothetical protein
MLVGAHLRNQTTLAQPDVTGFRSALFNGALLFSYQDPGLCAQLGTDPANCVVRLQDSVYSRVRNGHQEQYIPSWADYSRDAYTIIARFYPYGYRLFQLDNEPNLTWPHMTIGDHAANAADWNWFISNVIRDLRPHLQAHGMGDTKLGFTPMSMPSEHQEWWTNTHEARSLTDWTAAHCYWQAEADMQSEQFGAGYRWLSSHMDQLELNRPIIITEAANSASQETHPPTPAQLEALMSRQYPAYIEQVRRDHVGGVFFFILGSDPQWAGFNMSPSVLRSIGFHAWDGGEGPRR